jgi:F-box/leucine-rich repeat protein 2/20
MNCLLGLPNDILSFVLFPFFCTKDICSLDIAISNNILRRLLFEVYSSLNLGRENGSINRLKLLWFCKRTVYLDRLLFEHDLISYELTAIFDTLERCPHSSANITKIDFRSCVRNVHMSHISQMFSACKNLSTLVLTGYKRSELFSHSLRPLPHLTCLDLSKCQVSDAMAQSISDHCSALTTLVLQGCISLNNRAIIFLSQGCPSLTSLNVARCEKLTDVALIALSQGCSSLTNLDLKRVYKTTDSSIIALSQNCPSLSSLNLNGCGRVTDASVTALCQGCPSLSTLNLGKCKQITEAGLRVLSARFTSLTLLD